MFAPSLSAGQQRELAKTLTSFLSLYSHLTDSYIIEFFTEDLWKSLPSSWQLVLQGLSYQQIADLLLDTKSEDRRYGTVWPLSLLAFRTTAHSLAFPRECMQERGAMKPEEFQENQSQSSMLRHIFRKHVKPKKQHEIRKLGTLVKQLCQQTDCNKVVDVGSGQGHLTRFLSYGLELSVIAIEADHTLVAMASKFDEELVCALEKAKRKKTKHKKHQRTAALIMEDRLEAGVWSEVTVKRYLETFNCSSMVPVSQSSPCHVAGWVNPRASWEAFIQQLKTADCFQQGPLTPTGPSQTRLRGLDEVIQMSFSQGFTNSDSQSQDAEQCCSCVQSVPQQETSQPEYPDFVLTGLHACGDLSTTLLRHFVNCPHVRGITSVACCYMKLTTKENPSPPGLVKCPLPLRPSQELLPSEFGYPMSSWVQGLPGHQLSYKAREGACHAVEDYVRRLREESELLRTHCYRATLEVFIRDTQPDLCRAGVQTIKKSHMLPFAEYARLGLARVGLPPGLPLEPERVEAMLKQQSRVVAYFSLTLLLAPVVETLVLLDRMIYLQENGVDSQLVPLFNPNFSPRNFVLVALKARR